jgi:hypothetical protein
MEECRLIDKKKLWRSKNKQTLCWRVLYVNGCPSYVSHISEGNAYPNAFNYFKMNISQPSYIYEKQKQVDFRWEIFLAVKDSFCLQNVQQHSNVTLICQNFKLWLLMWSVSASMIWTGLIGRFTTKRRNSELGFPCKITFYNILKEVEDGGMKHKRCNRPQLEFKKPAKGERERNARKQ